MTRSTSSRRIPSFTLRSSRIANHEKRITLQRLAQTNLHYRDKQPSDKQSNATTHHKRNPSLRSKVKGKKKKSNYARSTSNSVSKPHPANYPEVKREREREREREHGEKIGCSRSNIDTRPINTIFAGRYKRRIIGRATTYQ